MTINDNTPLKDLREWIIKRLWTGDQVPCPCCGQKAQIHPWTFSTKLAFAIYELYRIDQADPGVQVHLHREVINPNPKRTNRSANQLHHWKLIKQANPQVPGKARDGLWIITNRGRQFVEGKVRIPKSIKIYDKGLMEESEETVSFLEALEIPFSYREVRGGAPLPLP